ncbi:MAG: hypothetical protein II748_07505, partial [Clostridia bacterium]|nr:hypothetical protein [Clostridia bacterium]
AKNGVAKVYDMGSRISADINIIVGDDTPTSQTELQKKFSSMYDISEDGKTISVISKEYLSEFWHSNYEKEIINSLTTEEVYFIIQDSIRIYMEYDKVVLAGFASVSSNKQVAERFPYIEDQEVCRPVTSYLDRDKIEKDIYTIILYRLTALSSPKTFFTGEEAILFVGRNPGVYSTMLPWTTFYIPNYSGNTDRENILSVVGQSVKTNVINIDLDLFGFCDKNDELISFKSKTTEQSIVIYPTDEIYKFPALDGLEEMNKDSESNYHETDVPKIENNTSYFKIDIQNGSCYLISSDGSMVEAKGFFTQNDNVYVLYFDNDYQYLFYYIEGIGFEYGKAESNPLPGYEFENVKPLVIEKDTLKSIGE